MACTLDYYGDRQILSLHGMYFQSYGLPEEWTNKSRAILREKEVFWVDSSTVNWRNVLFGEQYWPSQRSPKTLGAKPSATANQKSFGERQTYFRSQHSTS